MTTINTPDLGIKSGSNYAGWATQRLTMEEFWDLEMDQRLRYLVLCAHLAPSSHNTQPWAVRISCNPAHIEIFLDRGEYYVADDQIIDQRRVLAASDGRGRQACVSIGCFLTNMRVAAQYFGLTAIVAFDSISSADVKPVTEPNTTTERRYIPIATVQLEQTSGDSLSDRHIFEAIFTRRVCRHKYDLQFTIPPDVYDTMRAIAEEQQVGIQLLSRNRIADHLRMAALAELQFQADNHVANDSDFLQELGAWFLPNDTDSYLGMPGDTFGLQDAQALKFHHEFCNDLNILAEDRSSLARGSKAGMDSASLIGMLAVAEDTPPHWLNVGMTLEHIALLLERNRIQLAIHAGIGEVNWVRRSLGTFTGPMTRPVIVFRAGRTAEQTPHAPRLPLEHILLEQ